MRNYLIKFIVYLSIYVFVGVFNGFLNRGNLFQITPYLYLLFLPLIWQQIERRWFTKALWSNWIVLMILLVYTFYTGINYFFLPIILSYLGSSFLVNKKKKFLLLLAMSIIIFFVQLFLVPKLVNYSNYGINSRSEFAAINFSELTFLNIEKKQTKINLSGITLIDIWSVGCIKCFKDHKIIDSISKIDTNLNLLSICYSLGDSSKDFRMMRKVSNSFKSYYYEPKIQNDVLNISTFPTYYVVSGSDSILFKGDLENSLIILNKFKK